MFVNLLTPVFCLTLLIAAYLGFGEVHFEHDKVVHFVTFFILTLELWFLWDRLSARFASYLLVLFAAVISEFVQSAINPNRIFDTYDIYANVAGLTLAFTLCILAQLLRKKDRRKRWMNIEMEVQPSTGSVTPGSEEEVDGFVNVRGTDVV